MISFKFSVGGQQVEAQMDNAEEALKVITALTPKKAGVVTKSVRTRTAKASRKSYYVAKHKNAPRSWQRWTPEEVRAISDNRNLRARELVKIPVLSGRSITTLQAMRGCMINPARRGAPTNFRKIAAAVRASA